MKKKIMLYLNQSANSNYTYVSLTDMSEYNDKLIAPPITMEIDFNIYDEGVLRQKEIKSIDAQIDKLREEGLRKIIALANRKQELMAIEYDNKKYPNDGQDVLITRADGSERTAKFDFKNYCYSYTDCTHPLQNAYCPVDDVVKWSEI